MKVLCKHVSIFVFLKGKKYIDEAPISICVDVINDCLIKLEFGNVKLENSSTLEKCATPPCTMNGWNNGWWQMREAFFFLFF